MIGDYTVFSLLYAGGKLYRAEPSSVLNLCRGHIEGKKIPGLPDDFKVSERKITMGDLVEAEKNGSLLEVFGAGTAATVTAVDKYVPISPLSLSMTEWLTDVESGMRVGISICQLDPKGWVRSPRPCTTLSSESRRARSNHHGA